MQRRREKWVYTLFGLGLFAIPVIANDPARTNIGIANSALMIVLAFGAVCAQLAIAILVVYALGDRVVSVRIGAGLTVLHRRWWGREIILGVAPIFAGWSVITTRREGQRRRVDTALHVSGALLGVALVVVLVAGARDGRLSELGSQLAPDTLFVIAVAVTILFTAATRPSDELLLSWYRAGLSHEAQRLVDALRFDDAISILRKRLDEDPQDIEFQISLSGVLSLRGDHEKAFSILQDLRSRELPDRLRADVLNNWAWVCCMLGNDEHKRDAERASLELLAICERVLGKDQIPATVRDTHGHVMLWLKRYGEAEPLLRSGYETNPRANGRMCSAAGLAILCAATDRPDEAREWLDRARAEGIEHDLIARATAAVEPLSRK